MQKRKVLIIFNGKKYWLSAPTVGDLLFFQLDPQSFLQNLPFHFENKDQIELFLKEYFKIEEDIFELLQDKQEDVKLHILIAKLVKFFGNTFQDWLQMDLELFVKILKDFGEIVGEDKGKRTVGKATNAQQLKKLLGQI